MATKFGPEGSLLINIKAPLSVNTLQTRRAVRKIARSANWKCGAASSSPRSLARISLPSPPLCVTRNTFLISTQTWSALINRIAFLSFIFQEFARFSAILYVTCWVLTNEPMYYILQVSSDRLVTKQFRTKIPEKPNTSVNLWSILKNCIGRDLSKIPMPVSTLKK